MIRKSVAAKTIMIVTPVLLGGCPCEPAGSRRGRSAAQVVVNAESGKVSTAYVYTDLLRRIHIVNGSVRVRLARFGSASRIVHRVICNIPYRLRTR